MQDDPTNSHPGTIKGDHEQTDGVDWADQATVHLKNDGQGIFDALKGLHRGTLAEMVGLVSRMSPDERDKYVIEKAGDHELGIGEIMALAAHPDFPG